MPIEPPFPHRWDQLPDPRGIAKSIQSITTIELQERDWRKIVGKHFCRTSEPWQDVLPNAALKALRAAPNGPFDSTAAREATEHVLSAMGDQIRACLRRPLAMLYSSLQEGRTGQRRLWLLVLPCGAIAMVWATKSENLLKTCYFQGAAAVNQDGGERWRTALKRVVRYHTAIDSTTNECFYPAGTDRRQIEVEGQPAELRYEIAFITAESWGFDAAAPGSPWRMPSWDWEP